MKATLDRDRYPRAPPRLEPLRRPLAKLDPASVPKPAAPRASAASGLENTRPRITAMRRRLGWALEPKAVIFR